MCAPEIHPDMRRAGVFDHQDKVAIARGIGAMRKLAREIAHLSRAAPAARACTGQPDIAPEQFALHQYHQIGAVKGLFAIGKGDEADGRG